MNYMWLPQLIFNPNAKAQLARTACGRLFCSLSDARIGVSCRRNAKLQLEDARPSGRQPAVD